MKLKPGGLAARLRPICGLRLATPLVFVSRVVSAAAPLIAAVVIAGCARNTATASRAAVDCQRIHAQLVPCDRKWECDCRLK